MSYTLMDHQRDAIFLMKCNPSLAVYAEMGLGKTAIALSFVLDGMRSGEFKNAIVVCPASLVPSWKQAIEDMILFEGVTEEDVERLKSGVYITSYQKTYHHDKTPIHHKDGRVTYKKSLSLREIIDRHWNVMIVDESHSIGTHNSIQTKSAITLSKLSDRVYLLSGTPFHGPGGRPAYGKMYGQFQVLSKGTRWPTWTKFCEELVMSYDKWHNPRTFNEDKCKEIIKENSVTYRLADCIDMPERTEQTVPCPLEETKVYKDVKTGNVTPYGIDIETGGGQYIKLLQICSGSLKRREDTMTLKTSKDDVLKDLLEGTDEPVVIFCNFRASVDRCVDICKKTGRSVISFDGRSKGDEWKEFTSGLRNTIVCQYQSGGVGLNLQRSHVMILYEPCLSALLMEQAKGRIYRKGQSQKCIYYYLSTPKTIESRVLDSVRKGVDVSNDMLIQFAHME